MTIAARLLVLGSNGSPYTRKMLALLRYRRIPHVMVWGDARNPPQGLPKARVALLPTVYFPGAGGSLEPVVDSTPIIRRLEHEHAARSVIPPDPVLAFLAWLIEDFADEWLTKAMFHYRWRYAPDADQAGTLIPLWIDHTLPADTLAQFKQTFAARQIGRLGVVGSSPATAPLIEASYLRVLTLLDAVLPRGGFLFGRRPSCADFAVYGQLTQLARIDPTPAALALARAPRVCAWVDVIDDLSGLEPREDDWITREEAVSRLGGLLGEIGRVYAPYLRANAAALAAGEAEFTARIDGREWSQQSFPYQGKCLGWIEGEFAALDAPARAAAHAILRETGCDSLLGGSVA
jgi:glutathione S-transferase